MKSPHALLLASTAMFAIFAVQAPAHSARIDGTLTIAQNDKNGAEKDKKKDKAPKKPEAKKPDAKRQEKPAAARPQQKPAAPQQQQAQPAAPQKQQAQPAAKPEAKPAKPAAAQQKPEQAAPQRRGDDKQQRSRDEKGKAADEKGKNAEKRGERGDRNSDRKPAAQDRRAQDRQEKDRRDQRQQTPAAAEKQKDEQRQKSVAPADAQKKQDATKATTDTKKENADQRKNSDQKKQDAEKAKQDAEKARQAQPDKKQQSQPAQTLAPAKPGQSTTDKPAQTTTERNQQDNVRRNAVAPEQVKPHDASEFIQRKGEKASRGMDEVRKERRETREGNRVIIREGDRTIVHNDNRTIIRHNETKRFAVGARDVRVDRRNGETSTIIERPNGVRIVNVTDGNGHLIRRVRRERGGREVVIIDNSFARHRRPDVEVFVDLPPVRIRDRDRYYIDAGRASPSQIFAVFTAAPVMRIEDRYTVDQVRYSYPLRERMPRVELAIHFETGSWQLTPDQIDRLQVIADGLNRAIDKSPREVFLIEGHTDAVGTPEDNLSLSDRRAEAVAVALTEQFHVPPENLVTQGYGEEHLKVDTEEASRENRRVAVLRITPLIDQAQNAPQ